MDHGFNATYYSTAAQIIPVFFFAMVASKYFGPDDDEPIDQSFILLGTVLVGVAAELIALWAIAHRETPSLFEDRVITLGIVLPVLYVGMRFGGEPIEVLWRRLPAVVRKADDLILSLLLITCLFLYFVVHAKPVAVLAYATLALIMVPAIFVFARLVVGEIVIAVGRGLGRAKPSRATRKTPEE